MKLEMENLVGRKVLSAKINKEKNLIVLETDKHSLYLTWEGDCCADCYLAHVSGSDALIGATIIEANNTSWRVIKEQHECEVTESMGTRIKTDKGYVTFETRLEHNGYYSGNILISDEEPLDQYYTPRYDKGTKIDVKSLEDF